jgi:hypothetical protein
MWFDIDGNGTYDVYAVNGTALDTDGDTLPDQYALDTNGDNRADLWFMDVDENGVSDQAVADLDYDGAADVWYSNDASNAGPFGEPIVRDLHNAPHTNLAGNDYPGGVSIGGAMDSLGAAGSAYI